MINSEKLIETMVSHVKFGTGKVVDISGHYLKVSFDNNKKVCYFVYPEAFEKHLKALEKDVEISVMFDLSEKQNKVRAEREKRESIRKEKEEEIRSMHKAELVKKRKAQADKLKREKKLKEKQKANQIN